MTTHSSIHAREIPWTEEPGRLQSMGHKRVGDDLAIKQQKLRVGYQKTSFTINAKGTSLRMTGHSQRQEIYRRKYLTGNQWQQLSSSTTEGHIKMGWLGRVMVFPKSHPSVVTHNQRDVTNTLPIPEERGVCAHQPLGPELERQLPGCLILKTSRAPLQENYVPIGNGDFSLKQIMLKLTCLGSSTKSAA